MRDSIAIDDDDPMVVDWPRARSWDLPLDRIKFCQSLTGEYAPTREQVSKAISASVGKPWPLAMPPRLMRELIAGGWMLAADAEIIRDQRERYGLPRNYNSQAPKRKEP